MPYVRRGHGGEIEAVSAVPKEGFAEELSAEAADLRDFLARIEVGRDDLAGTDQGFIRVLEDLIEVLVARNVIRFTDLPDAAQAKMMQRQQLREALRPHVDLLDDERDDPLI